MMIFSVSFFLFVTEEILYIILVYMAVIVLWTTPDISKGLALLQIQDIDFINEFRILIL